MRKKALSKNFKLTSFWVIACIVFCLGWSFVAMADGVQKDAIPLNRYGVRSLNPYVVERFSVDGKPIEKVIVPGPPTPPVGVNRPLAVLKKTETAAGINVLPNVPALSWSFGCSATSAAMMFGYYDNTAFPRMYTGPTNGGVFPMTNEPWGTALINEETRALCPLSATRMGLDGRTVRGHVDDYWIAYKNEDPDPYVTDGWSEHVWGDCTADFMGTNQSRFSNTDGATAFYFYSSGDRLVDYIGGENTRDGCHGMKLFAQSRGYTVSINFNQLIVGSIYKDPGADPSNGFSFEDYKAEIDAGRPVIIQVTGHTMLGLGYDDAGETIFIHDTWDHDTHTMTWGGKYVGMQHWGVAVLRLEPSETPPITTGCPCPADGQISNVTYAEGECVCENADSLTFGEGVEILDGAVIHFSAGVSITFSAILSIPSGATVVFTAPLVTLNPGFQAAEGAAVTIQQP